MIKDGVTDEQLENAKFKILAFAEKELFYMETYNKPLGDFLKALLYLDYIDHEQNKRRMEKDARNA